MRTHRAAVLLPKRRLVRLASEYLHETVQSPVLLEPRDMAYIEKCRCKGFSRGIMLGAFNKLTIFLARPVTLPPFRAKTSPRLFCRSTGTRRKALLMRSLIRSIGECFADRSDVYPPNEFSIGKKVRENVCRAWSFVSSANVAKFLDRSSTIYQTFEREFVSFYLSRFFFFFRKKFFFSHFSAR